MEIPKIQRWASAWCLECECIEYEDGADAAAKRGWTCSACGSKLTRVENLEAHERKSLRQQLWWRSLRPKGLRGWSPGGAAQRLRCSRSMIDKLVDREVLEKSVYDHDGTFVVVISDRSIKRAMESKRKTGKWTKLKLDDEENSEEGSKS